tara:strand:+ start:448 stop:639 length:192 start_codon:yes stop_codon:yes gene_type:complete
MSRIRRVLKKLNNKLRTPTKSTFDHKGYKQLSKLSDYELKDIGITRGDIDHVCSGGTVRRGEN